MIRAKGGRPENRGSFAVVVRQGRVLMSGPYTEWPPGAPAPRPLRGGHDDRRPAENPPVPDGSEPAPQPGQEPPPRGDQAG